MKYLITKGCGRSWERHDLGMKYLITKGCGRSWERHPPSTPLASWGHHGSWRFTSCSGGFCCVHVGFLLSFGDILLVTDSFVAEPVIDLRYCNATFSCQLFFSLL